MEPTGEADLAADPSLVAAIRDAYEVGADGWAAGPTSVYDHLARALVGAARSSLADRTVLDLGTGTGVASQALLEAGARPIGVDLAVAMLRHRRRERPPAVAADARALPFAAATFDAVVAAFCLNHLPDPVAGLAECRRVLRTGGVVLASTFPADASHPAKDIVESTLTAFGYRRPDWYQTFKERLAERTGDPAALAAAAGDAGFSEVEVVREEVEAGLDRPEVAVDWRLNMPHTLAFVAGLDADERARLRAEALAGLAGDMPSAVPVLMLRARAGVSERLPRHPAGGA